MNREKVLKVKFTDFWDGFGPNDEFYRLLSDNFEIEESDNPNYVIYSCFGEQYLNYPDAVRILFIGENIIPDFNTVDYAIGFNYISFDDRYLRYPLYFLSKDELRLAEKKHIIIDEEERKSLLNRKFCSFMCSNVDPFTPRDKIFYKLSEYKQVDSGGVWLNNIGGPIPRGPGKKTEWQKGYKFSICFENSVENGYVTEKLQDGFAARTVPIYLGASTVCRDFNAKAFIDCSNFNSFDEVLEYVKELDNNDEEYLKILATPAFSDNNMKKEEADRQFISFFSNIFSQDKEKAFRRKSIYFATTSKLEERMQAYKLQATYPRFRHLTQTMLKIEKEEHEDSSNIISRTVYKTMADFFMGKKSY